jgi:hypothetical protein
MAVTVKKGYYQRRGVSSLVVAHRSDNGELDWIRRLWTVVKASGQPFSHSLEGLTLESGRRSRECSSLRAPGPNDDTSHETHVTCCSR